MLRTSSGLDELPAFLAAGGAGLLAGLADFVVLFVLAALLLAVVAHVDAELGEFFQAGRIERRETHERSAARRALLSRRAP